MHLWNILQLLYALSYRLHLDGRKSLEQILEHTYVKAKQIRQNLRITSALDMIFNLWLLNPRWTRR